MSSEVIFLSEVSQWKSQFQEVRVRRNKNLLDEVKNIAAQVLTYNSKNFYWLNRKTTSNGLWMVWKNHLGKKIQSKKNEKTVKIKVKLPHVKKTTNEKANFCSNTFFILYFKMRAKKFHAAKPLAFSLHFLFRRDQNHYSNLTSNIMKMCEQILKNTAGRIPETTRSGNPLQCHRTSHQTKLASTNLGLF